MPRGVATLSLPTPFEVARAIASSGRYHYGVPNEGLSASFSVLDDPAVQFTASAPLVPGQRYIDRQLAWWEFLAGFGIPEEVLVAILQRFLASSGAGALIALFGYLPLKLQIPSLGGPMTFSPHGVVVLLGHYGASGTSVSETWSCSMSYDVVGADVGAMPNTIGDPALEEIFDAWSDVITAADASAFSPYTWLDGIAYYRRKADGTSTTGTWERFLSPDPVAGTGTAPGNSHSLQDALVVTFDAGGARGGRFGRIYMPAPAQALTVGQYPSSVPEALSENAVTALTAVNATLTGVVADSVELVVASGRDDGENRPVRVVKCGRVPDTQRRRRRSLSEAYVEQPFQSI